MPTPIHIFLDTEFTTTEDPRLISLGLASGRYGDRHHALADALALRFAWSEAWLA